MQIDSLIYANNLSKEKEREADANQMQFPLKDLQECGNDGLLHILLVRAVLSASFLKGKQIQRHNTLHSKHRFKTDYTTTECIKDFLQHTVLVIIGMPVRQITLKLMSAATVCIIQAQQVNGNAY